VNRFLFTTVACLLILTGSGLHAAAGVKPTDLQDGDRVVLLGNTFIERDQEYGYLETLLTLRHPRANITFRNLGWSGDAVTGIARARFGTPEEGFQHLKEHVLALKPTVLLVGYGLNESFAGEKGLLEFEKGLNRLLDTLAETKARIVLISPIRHEELGRPLPDPTRHNSDLERYVGIFAAVADRRGYQCIDLFHDLARPSDPKEHWTDDGIHLTELGYWYVAKRIADGLEPQKDQRERWSVAANFVEPSRPQDVRGWRLNNVRTVPAGFQFEATCDLLPMPPIPLDPKTRRAEPHDGMMILLQVPGRLTWRGMPPPFVGKVDGQELTMIVVIGGKPPSYLLLHPDLNRVEQLRATINKKNKLYFHRWRPQNETYLFGFRKHEQGQNSREIPLFDPLIAEKEKVIAGLCVPVSHKYELLLKDEVTK
jgi:lysophospholipase L1-like esterase